MNSYLVHVTKYKSLIVQVEAANSSEANDIVFERLMSGEINLTADNVVGKIEINVDDGLPIREDDSPSIKIYWDDLSEEKQNEILDLFGNNNNYDVFPIAEIPPF